jgi:DNA cross-link repair 1B protein
VALKDLT